MYEILSLNVCLLAATGHIFVVLYIRRRFVFRNPSYFVIHCYAATSSFAASASSRRLRRSAWRCFAAPVSAIAPPAAPKGVQSGKRFAWSSDAEVTDDGACFTISTSSAVRGRSAGAALRRSRGPGTRTTSPFTTP